jgi:hypothetical protein
MPFSIRRCVQPPTPVPRPLSAVPRPPSPTPSPRQRKDAANQRELTMTPYWLSPGPGVFGPTACYCL